MRFGLFRTGAKRARIDWHPRRPRRRISAATMGNKKAAPTSSRRSDHDSRQTFRHLSIHDLYQTVLAQLLNQLVEVKPQLLGIDVELFEERRVRGLHGAV